ncbi:hypothetical protein BABINDRAFT_33672 [Babjeviella inositovora NRRL Y-12698]|uniref:Glycylpeptide N-tetradecanoyltransferase n=1 Tax=Babjeviella inositovora NRRL Y-12698 TaxID=984486 RepID=A0A1E3QTY9_9ASCO|nr:uncharacterized protein BABINDRAFT_33672 [Babjeviella inositovora NRRL Y-12698]ODQ81153.1 hypothetical protein BABINDRAFT_33672 [Babjeviella inositovora NRRL Y-12698]
MSEPKKSLEDLLRMLAMGHQLTESQQKDMTDYKFWKTQPVPNFTDKIETEGPIERAKRPEDIPSQPFPLLSDFEWVDMDLTSQEDLTAVHELLYENYVEDQDATFRFNYSTEFFNWALKPPGWKKEWHVGVRVKATGRLVAFISAVPITLELRTRAIPSVEINFLCIHKKLRTKRLAPVLIKEITRRVNRHDIWQALYTAGIVLPAPVATCRYTHRPINWATLHDVKFSHLPPNKTKAQMVAHYAVPLTTSTVGLRRAVPADAPAIHALFDRYQAHFDLIQTFTRAEVDHWLMGGESTVDGASKVVHTYVVETEGKITDFFSFYLLPFTVLGNPQHDQLGVAYLFYYASDTGLDADRFDAHATAALATRLTALMGDALVIAQQLGVDVFNALTSQDNNLFMNELKFGAGDGYLNFYLFNYKSFPITGGINPQTKEIDVAARSGVGVVML